MICRKKRLKWYPFKNSTLKSIAQLNTWTFTLSKHLNNRKKGPRVAKFLWSIESSMVLAKSPITFFYIIPPSMGHKFLIRWESVSTKQHFCLTSCSPMNKSFEHLTKINCLHKLAPRTNITIPPHSTQQSICNHFPFTGTKGSKCRSLFLISYQNLSLKICLASGQVFWPWNISITRSHYRFIIMRPAKYFTRI